MATAAAVGVATAAACAASRGCLRPRGGGGAAAAAAGGAARVCRRCGAALGREHFTAKQWARPDAHKRTCNACCEALTLQRQAADRAAPPKAWSSAKRGSGRPSRGKAPRHQLSGKPPIVVAENIDDYRGAIAQHVRATDIALEVGCHQGSTTVLLDNACQLAVGVDKGQLVLSEGRRLHPQLSLHDLDATDLGGLGRLDKECGPFTVIFIDVGGGSVQSVAKLWALIESYSAVLSPRLFVVKSFKLAELLQRCQAGAVT